MTLEEIIAYQKVEREKCIAAILSSNSNKKLIIAGAGTGKTFTFKQLLQTNKDGTNIAMTFIRMLSMDMDSSFGELAEVKTFHAYCKKVLHEQNGKVNLIPFLTKIIEEDASYLELNFNEFDKKFQNLEKDSAEIKFYLKRGDYYDAVAFNDSVYRLYKALLANPDIVPIFNHILIDEFQDFNPLEVAFINELEKRGNILIVGDDDQAVYEGRSASPKYLRDKFSSGEYELFELPFCSRCTKVIVDATNNFLEKAEKKGFLTGRAKKRYDCFLEAKASDSKRFPKIISVQFKVGKTITKYIDNIIENLEQDDITESWKEGSEYTTVLIVGPKQYLAIIQKELGVKYPQMTLKISEEIPLKVLDGYNLLLQNIESNLGWRVIIDFYFKNKDIKKVIKETDTGKSMIQILPQAFIDLHKRVVEIIRIIKKDEEFTDELKAELKKLTDNYYDQLIEYYTPKKKEEESKPDKLKPSILLSSFVGCKGLSAGHVLIIGANNGCIPKDKNSIKDVEIAQFMVAMTRTRKQCHIISNQWQIAPFLKGIFQTKYEKSEFIKWIPTEFINDKGLISSANIK